MKLVYCTKTGKRILIEGCIYTVIRGVGGRCFGKGCPDEYPTVYPQIFWNRDDIACPAKAGDKLIFTALYNK